MQVQHKQYQPNTLKPHRQQAFLQDLLKAYLIFSEINSAHMLNVQEFDRHVWSHSQIRFLTNCRSQEQDPAEYYHCLYAVLIGNFMDNSSSHRLVLYNYGNNMVGFHNNNNENQYIQSRNININEKLGTIFTIFSLYFLYFTSCERSQNIQKIPITPSFLTHITDFLHKNKEESHLTYFKVIKAMYTKGSFQFCVKDGVRTCVLREEGQGEDISVGKMRGQSHNNYHNRGWGQNKGGSNHHNNSYGHESQKPVFEKSHFVPNFSFIYNQITNQLQTNITELEDTWNQYQQMKNEIKAQEQKKNSIKKGQLDKDNKSVKNPNETLENKNKQKQMQQQTELELSKTDRFLPSRLKNLLNNYENQVHKMNSNNRR